MIETNIYNTAIKRSNKYDGIDGLRAYSALGIAMMHILANMNYAWSGNFVTGQLIPSFTNFVFLFMIISAFGLCCGYYEKVKTGKFEVEKFYKKRYARLLPFFGLLVCIDAVAEHSLNSFYEAFADLTLCFALLPNPDIKVIGVGWYIGIVFLFYMLFPFFVFAIGNRKRAWITLALSLVFCFMAINYFFTDRFIHFPLSRHNIIYSAPLFIMGGVVYLYKEKLIDFSRKHNWLMLLICLSLIVLHFSLKHMYEANIVFVIAMCILNGAFLIYSIGNKPKWLYNKVTKYLGDISLEIYLCHMLCFRVVCFAHLERYIENHFALYAVTTLLTLVSAVIFSHIFKYEVFPRVGCFLRRVNAHEG